MHIVGDYFSAQSLQLASVVLSNTFPLGLQPEAGCILQCIIGPLMMRTGFHYDSCCHLIQHEKQHTALSVVMSHFLLCLLITQSQNKFFHIHCRFFKQKWELISSSMVLMSTKTIKFIRSGWKLITFTTEQHDTLCSQQAHFDNAAASLPLGY